MLAGCIVVVATPDRVSWPLGHQNRTDGGEGPEPDKQTGILDGVFCLYPKPALEQERRDNAGEEDRHHGPRDPLSPMPFNTSFHPAATRTKSCRLRRTLKPYASFPQVSTHKFPDVRSVIVTESCPRP